MRGRGPQAYWCPKDTILSNSVGLLYLFLCFFFGACCCTWLIDSLTARRYGRKKQWSTSGCYHRHPCWPFATRLPFFAIAVPPPIQSFWLHWGGIVIYRCNWRLRGIHPSISIYSIVWFGTFHHPNWLFNTDWPLMGWNSGGRLLQQFAVHFTLPPLTFLHRADFVDFPLNW